MSTRIHDMEKTTFNVYGNLSVDLIEKWLDEQIKIMEGRPWNNGVYGSNTDQKSIEILLENKIKIDTLKDIKKQLSNLDLMLVSSPNWRKRWGLKSANYDRR